MSGLFDPPLAPYEQTIEAEDAKQFLHLLSPNSDRWVEGNSLSYVFRGVSNMDYLLTPSLLRPTSDRLMQSALDSTSFDDAETLEAVKATGLDQPYASRYVILLRFRHAEHKFLADFAELADEVGISTPAFPYDGPPAVPRGLSIRAECRLPARERSAIPGSMPNELTALAQHHGALTRLLDWTTNPLAAAFFAADGSAPDDATHLGVYALLKRGWHVNQRNHTGLQLFTPRRSQNTFMLAQRGLFTWVGDADAHLVESGKTVGTEAAIAMAWDALDEDRQRFLIDVGPFTLIRITLSRMHLADLHARLLRHGISRAHMMPTLDNVARSLSRQWEVGDKPTDSLLRRILYRKKMEQELSQ